MVYRDNNNNNKWRFHARCRWEISSSSLFLNIILISLFFLIFFAPLSTPCFLNIIKQEQRRGHFCCCCWNISLLSFSWNRYRCCRRCCRQQNQFCSCHKYNNNNKDHKIHIQYHDFVREEDEKKTRWLLEQQQ